MKLYESKLKNGFLFFIFKVIYICILISPFIFFTEWKDYFLNLEIWKWALFGISIIVMSYTYISLTNNDIKLDQNTIEFERKLFPFKRTVNFNLKDVLEITMQHDWTDTILENLKPKFLKYLIVEWVLKMILAEDYKWVKITTSEKSYKFYCFGLEHDYYDNPKPYFEDLYLELAKHQLNVNWTKNNDIYYKGITETKIKLQKKPDA
jgi:hypothetical protein